MLVATWCALVSIVPRVASQPFRDEVGAKLLNPDLVPLKTRARYIIDRRGERIKWACVNWGGAYTRRHVVGGLEAQPLNDLAHRIRELGFNCVRLPYSTQGFLENPELNESDLAANPDLKGKRFLEVFDATVEALTNQGLMVILNNHNHRSGWCCHITQDEGLWYIPGEYPESLWIETLGNVTSRYKLNKLVVAHDIRNEPHNYRSPSGKMTQITWGDGVPETDWAAAAERGGNAVLAANPDQLVVVNAPCFGMELRPLANHQVRLSIENRTIYQAHNYMEFQIFGLISARFVGWSTLREVLLPYVVVLAAVLLAVAWTWSRMGMPLPPLPSALITIGSWVCVAGVLGLSVSLFMYLMMLEYCSFVAKLDVLPWLVFTSVVTISSLAAVVGGCACHCARRRRPQAYVGSARDGIVPSAPAEGGPPPHRGGCCGAPGYASCRRARRQWVLCAGRCDPSAPVGHLVAKVPKDSDVEWDTGLCVGFQVCSCLTLLWVIITLLFIWAHIFPSYWWMERHFDSTFGFALEHGQPWTAPVWLGEFGALSPGNYWNNLLRYVGTRDIDWAYWPLNGLKFVEGFMHPETYKWIDYEEPVWEDDSFSVLEPDFDTVRAPWRLIGLQALMESPARWTPGEKACTRDSYGAMSCGG